MPIITGFPPSNTISPSVRITEQDLSYYTSTPTFHNAGIIGFCSKGPINKPTIVTSKNQLNQIFGYPHPDVSDPYLIYAAEQYLLVSSQLYVVRCADTNQVDSECAAIASVEIPAAGTLIQIAGDIPQAIPSTGTGTATTTSGFYNYYFETAVFPNGGAFFSWSLNGQVSPNTLVITVPSPAAIAANPTAAIVSILMPDGTTQTVTGNANGITYNANQLAALLNNQINPTVEGVVFGTSNKGTIEVSTVWAYGPSATLEFMPVQDCAYGKYYRASNVAMTAAPIKVNVLQLAVASVNNQNATVGGFSQTCISGINSYGSGSNVAAGTWNFSGLSNLAGTLNLQVVVTGTDNQAIDNQVQNYDLTGLLSTCAIPGHPTTTEICTFIQNQINSSATDSLGGFVPVNSNGYLRLDMQYCGNNSAIIVKPACTANLYFQFDGVTKYGYDYQGDMTSADPAQYGIVSGGPAAAGVYSFNLTADSPGIEGNNTYVTIVNDITENVFSMTVYNNNVQLESWGGLTMDPTSTRYVGTYLALVSNYVAAVVPASGSLFMSGPPPTNGTYYLGQTQATAGSDGIPALPDQQDALLVGNAVAYTGLYALSDPEQVDIDIIAVPGHSSTDVISSLITFCGQYRQDCIAIVDPPFGLSVQEIIAWQNGAHPLNNERFDSDFLALYWPWVQIYDTYNQINVWVPPSGSIMAVYAYSDNLSAPWFAPAGQTRGIVPGIINVFNRPTLAERDSMYGNANCINPIVQFSDLSNFVVWGQKTMQRLPTALDRVNVRRLLFYIEKQIRQASRAMLFDPNDALFQKKFEIICKKILDQVKAGRGVYDYIIKDDSSINTPDVIDRNEFRANIGIQPEKAVEFMFLTFTINKTGDWTQPATNTVTIT